MHLIFLNHALHNLTVSKKNHSNLKTVLNLAVIIYMLAFNSYFPNLLYDRYKNKKLNKK